MSDQLLGLFILVTVLPIPTAPPSRSEKGGLPISVTGGQWGRDECFEVGPLWDRRCEFRRVWHTEPGVLRSHESVYIRVVAPGEGVITIGGVSGTLKTEAP